MANADSARGMIAVDKMGGKVLFLNPVTYETEVVLDGFPRTVHELLVVPETGLAYVPIFGDGIHGRNPNPHHLLCIFDLEQRSHVGDIDLRPYIAPHTLKLGPDGLIYITCENSAVVSVIDRTSHKVVDAIDSGSTNGQNNFYLGASMYHINRPKVGFKDKNWYLTGRISIHGGGSFPISDMLTIHTSLIHQIQNKASETTVGAAIAANLNQDAEKPASVYIGSWVRFNDAIVPYIGIEFGGLRIGASYDFNISSLKAATASRGGSEFSLIYIKRPADYKGIPCPKF